MPLIKLHCTNEETEERGSELVQGHQGNKLWCYNQTSENLDAEPDLHNFATTHYIFYYKFQPNFKNLMIDLFC